MAALYIEGFSRNEGQPAVNGRPQEGEGIKTLLQKGENEQRNS